MTRPIIEIVDFSLPEGEQHIRREMNDTEYNAYLARIQANEEQSKIKTLEEQIQELQQRIDALEGK